MRKAMLIGGLALLIAVLILLFTSRPSMTLAVLALTNDSRVSEMYAGSNFQSVVALVEMKNHSNRDLMYTTYLPCPRFPNFKCRYREAGVWQDETLLTADWRASIECPAAITGLPWGPRVLKPSEKVLFKADVLKPNTECRIVVDYWVPGQRKRWYHRLPAWIARRLPGAQDTLEAETKSIPNGSDR